MRFSTSCLLLVAYLITSLYPLSFYSILFNLASTLTHSQLPPNLLTVHGLTHRNCKIVPNQHRYTYPPHRSVPKKFLLSRSVKPPSPLHLPPTPRSPRLSHASRKTYLSAKFLDLSLRIQSMHASPLLVPLPWTPPRSSTSPPLIARGLRVLLSS